jgi:hypothetical protein
MNKWFVVIVFYLLSKVSIINNIVKYSWIIKKDVVLLKKINIERDKHPYLKAVFFLFPSEENLKKLSGELKDPLYSDYYICM